jgi:hypothetical protein
MPYIRRSIATTLACLASLACLAPAAGAVPNNMVALAVGPGGNTLYRFSGDTPGTATPVPVTGLGTTALVAIDYRPATQGLYGLGVEGETVTLFAIDPTTGVATAVAPATSVPIAGATAFGMAFQPVADRVRVVDDLGTARNFRLNPATGTPVIDTNPIYSELPGGEANAPEVAVAYDRDVAGATVTTLYGIVSGGDRLVTQGSPDGTPTNPNGGILFDVGPLGVDTSKNAGLDIDPPTGEAYAVLEVGDQSGLYRIDLATGGATALGLIGAGNLDFGSLTIGPQLPPTPLQPSALQSLSLNPTRFRAAGSRKAKAKASTKKAPVGTTVSYTVSAGNAPTLAVERVVFAVERKQIGRKVGKACKPKTRANADHKPCTLWKRLKPTLSRSFADGANSFRFNGKLGGKPLRPSAYKMRASLNSSSLSKRFRIVP